MKNKFIKILNILALLTLIFYPSQIPLKASDTVAVNLSVDNINPAINSAFKATISLSTGAITVGAIEINLNYDQSKLKYSSIIYPTGFDTALEENIFEDVGIVHMVRGKSGGFNGQAAVAIVNFQTIAAGSANFSLSPLDGADDDGNRLTLSSNSLSISITNPAPTPTSPATPSAPSTPSPITPTTKKATKSKTTTQKPAASSNSTNSTSTPSSVNEPVENPVVAEPEAKNSVSTNEDTKTVTKKTSPSTGNIPHRFAVAYLKLCYQVIDIVMYLPNKLKQLFYY